ARHTLFEPTIQTGNALRRRRARHPPRRRREARRISHVIALVPDAPIGELRVYAQRVPVLQQRNELEEAERVTGASAYVESASRQLRHALAYGTEGVHEIFRIEYIAHLAAIPENGQGSPAARLDDEVCHPALIFIAELMRSVDAAHPEHHGGHAVRTRVVENVLVGGTFRAPIGTVKIQRLRFRYSPRAEHRVHRRI